MHEVLIGIGRHLNNATAALEIIHRRLEAVEQQTKRRGVGSFTGYLLAAFCPEIGPRHPALLWGIVGATTMVGPLGIVALRRVIEGARPVPGGLPSRDHEGTLA